MVKVVDMAGFAALWLREVPFDKPNFGEVAQLVGPTVYSGWIAPRTRSIAIGTAGVVLQLRDPYRCRQPEIAGRALEASAGRGPERFRCHQERTAQIQDRFCFAGISRFDIVDCARIQSQEPAS